MKKDINGYYSKSFKGITFYYRTIEELNHAIEQYKIFLEYTSQGNEEDYYKKYSLRK